jgi:hypothetical protein
MLPRSLPVLNAFSRCLLCSHHNEKAKPSFPPYTRPARSDLKPTTQSKTIVAQSIPALGVVADTGHVAKACVV